ncbi:tyrosine phosphatase family-domain-containing protein [Pyrenochaeta sp. MPI-SDFR-AT-0127]|nr:tyrosine phosphatase family-domain-containing protein [Pyrenochaeta sp. MPI-SDFR-AT-0127]
MTTQKNPSLPQPPFYSIANINNLRDAALYPLATSSGARIRPGVLFRSAEVSKLDLSGWQAVHSVGVAHVFDLRSKPEVDKGWAGIVGNGVNGDDVRPGWIEAMEQAGVQRTWTPVFAEADYSPERLAERYVKYMDEEVKGFVEAYEDILKNGGGAFRTIFLYLANLPAPRSEGGGADEKLGALIHCTAGKDRTGIFFGILFDFLQVPRETIAEEYNLTELGLRHIREDVVGRLMQSPGFKKYIASKMAGKPLSADDIASSLRTQDQEAGSEGAVEVPPEILEKGRQAALRMIGARKESMLKALEMVDGEFGGAEAYMRKHCGLGDEELEALRRNLVLGA